MTLHWWMHWFWITRPVAVAAQLLFLLASVQTVPLPGSTLFPHESSHHPSRTPTSSWVSGNPTSSVYADQNRQTVVYENGPLWSSSPDIEEPFYPTTASSDRLDSSSSSSSSSSNLPTENIPLTPKSISPHELHSETYPPNLEESEQSTNPTEFAIQSNGQQQPYFEEPLVLTHSSITADARTDKSDEDPSLEDLGHSYHDNWEEPRALPLELSPQETIIQNKAQISVLSAESKAAPKNVGGSNQQNEGETSPDNFDSNISKVTFINSSVSNFNVGVSAQDVKHGQRLVTRDLANVSEPVLPSLSSSHGSNSTNSGNSSLRPNNRNSKAIGHFSSASETLSSDVKKDPISNPDKVEGYERNEQALPEVGLTKENNNSKEEVSSEIAKTAPSKLEKNQKANESDINSTTPLSVLPNPQHPPPLEEEAQLNSRRSKPESDSSKLASENVNKTRSNASSTVPSNAKNPTAQKDLATPRAAAPSPNASASGVREKGNAPVTPIEVETPDRITTLPDGEEIGGLTPAQIHGQLGRSASLSHEEETTVEPSVAPVSKSRVAASPAEASPAGLDAASITGIALGIVVFAGLAGAVSFVLYRRRYLNKPQTLNDKCSNPDSSGYIDDSTLRENSEEMYSLDNDSFLNSLEAMTIQNYWTDNVKHTKL